MGKRVILIDFAAPSDWSFLKALEESTKETWGIVSCESNRLHGGIIQKLKRYLKYFIFPFEILLNRKKYDKVVAWQQFYGLILAFYLRVFHAKTAPEITIMTFIYKPKKSIIGKLYNSFMNYTVHSGYIKRFVVFSESEAEYYANLFNISKTCFHAETLGIDDTAKNYCDIEPCGDIYVSAGRSNRDYEFLQGAWKDMDCSLEIICDEEKEHDADKITYYTNCHGEEYMKRLARAHAVIIPLRDENISSGQLVMLQAMMLGKPIIVTENNTVSGYITDGYNGLIIEKKEAALKAAVTKINGGGYYDSLCENSRKTYEEKFSMYAMGLRIGQYL